MKSGDAARRRGAGSSRRTGLRPGAGRSRPRRAVLGRDVALEAAHDHDRLAARPCAARAPRPRRPRRRPRRSSRSARGPPRRGPRRSSSGASPAQPIATSSWPRRHARPKLSETTTAGGDAEPLGERGAQRARRGVGVRGQQAGRVVAGHVRLVDAGVRAHEAVLGPDDQHAARRRAGPRALVEDQLHERGSLPSRRPARAPRAPGSTVRGARAGPRPSRPPSGRRPRRRRRRSAPARRPRRSAPPRSSPGSISGSPASGSAERLRLTPMPRRGRACARSGAARRVSAARGRASARARPRSATRSSRVSTSSASERQLARPRRRGRGARACSTWRSQRARAELRLERARRGRAPARWCPVPWRSGTITTSGAGRRARARRQLGRIEQRAVAGHQQRALAAERRGPRDPASAAARLALLDRSSCDQQRVPRPDRRRAPAADRPRRRTITLDRRAPSPSAASTSATIAAASAARGIVRRASPESRCFAASKRLTGRIAAARTRQTTVSSAGERLRRSRASRGRAGRGPAASPISVSVSCRTTPTARPGRPGRPRRRPCPSTRPA